MAIRVRIYPTSLRAYLSDIEKKVETAAQKGLIEGADEIRDYLKYEIMNGEILQARSNQLRNSLYINRKTPMSLSIQFRGTHRKKTGDEWAIPNAALANILEEGVGHSWFQPVRGITHPGIRPHYFMKRALDDKRKRVRELVDNRIKEALRRRSRG